MVEVFLGKAEAPRAVDALLNELTKTVLPNLERFPGIGRLLLGRPARSVEALSELDRLTQRLGAIAKGCDVREYVTTHYLLLYARIEGSA